VDTIELLAALKQYGMSGDNAAGLANNSGLTNSFGSIGSIKPLELGWNMPTAQLGLQGVGTLGNLWSAFQAGSMAKKQFGLQRDMANANLGNQIASYNTSLESKAKGAAQMRGDNPDTVTSYVDDYLQRHALRRDGQINNGAPKTV
jgi:hypothetical protein